MTRKIVSETTYNVSSGTLNSTIPYHTTLTVLVRHYKHKHTVCISRSDYANIGTTKINHPLIVNQTNEVKYFPLYLPITICSILPLVLHTLTAGIHSVDVRSVAVQQLPVKSASLVGEVRLQDEQQLESCEVEQTASSGTAVHFLSLLQVLQQHYTINYDVCQTGNAVNRYTAREIFQ